MPPTPRPGETIGEALRRVEERLQRAGLDEPRQEARWLVSQLLDTDSGGLLIRRGERLPDDLAPRLAAWVDRRAAREPRQHIVGSAEFYGLEFAVDGRVLIPRPETEGIVDAALSEALPDDAEVADLGTGSGCIVVTLAVHRVRWRLRALDRSSSALAVARANARRHGVDRRVAWAHAELATPPRGWDGTLHLVVCNPPYVAEADWAVLEPEVRDHEPRQALVAGASGLEAYRALAPAARRLLRPAGRLILELGYGQDAGVRELLARHGFDVLRVVDDLRGIPRVLVAARGGDDGQHR